MTAAVIVCMPVSETPKTPLGAVKDKCRDCGTEVWICSSSWPLITDLQPRVVCNACCVLRLARAKNPRVHGPTEAQLEEIKELRGLSELKED